MGGRTKDCYNIGHSGHIWRKSFKDLLPNEGLMTVGFGI